jgi:uncharacterized membrane protein YwaF
MHSIMVIGGGLVLLALFVLVGKQGGLRSASKAALWFIPVWLLAAIANLWMGVSRAGYTVAQELPFLLLVFGVPAAMAAVIWQRFSRRD